MAELDPADWDCMMAINVTGAYNYIWAVVPELVITLMYQEYA